MQHKLILWDIDGTLTRGTMADQFNAALAEVYGLELPIKKVLYGGKTDGQIVHETLALYDWEPQAIDQHWELFQVDYIKRVQAIEHALADTIHLIDGVVPALMRLGKYATHSLLTGNLCSTAQFKLNTVGLSQWFKWEWGAFGSDNHDRLKLVPIALERARSDGWAGTNADVFVIGDTVNDIACARAGGVNVIAVATGHTSIAELAAHQPDRVVASLDEIGEV